MRYRIVREEVFMNVRTYEITVLHPVQDLVLDDLTDPSGFQFVRPCNTQSLDERPHIVTPDDFEVLQCYTRYYDRYTNECTYDCVGNSDLYNALFEEYLKELCSIKFRNFKEFLLYGMTHLPEVNNNTLFKTGTSCGEIASKRHTSYARLIYKVL